MAGVTYCSFYAIDSHDFRRLISDIAHNCAEDVGVDIRHRESRAILGDRDQRNAPSPVEDLTHRVRNVDEMSVVGALQQVIQGIAKLEFTRESATGDICCDLIKLCEDVHWLLNFLNIFLHSKLASSYITANA